MTSTPSRSHYTYSRQPFRSRSNEIHHSLHPPLGLALSSPLEPKVYIDSDAKALCNRLNDARSFETFSPLILWTSSYPIFCAKTTSTDRRRSHATHKFASSLPIYIAGSYLFLRHYLGVYPFGVTHHGSLLRRLNLLRLLTPLSILIHEGRSLKRSSPFRL